MINKKSILDSIIVFVLSVLIIVVIALIPIALVTKISKQENDYLELQDKYTNALIDSKEYETAYEFIEEYTSEYMSAQEYAFAKLQDRYDELLEMYVYEHNPELDDNLISTNNEFKEKLISDVDDLIDYFWNYQSFVESNPDITLSQYVKIRDIELHTRIKEYFGWTDWE